MLETPPTTKTAFKATATARMLPLGAWWPRLRELRLNANRIEGSLPGVGLGQCAELQLLHLGSNIIAGAIPRELGGCRALRELQLQGNQVSVAVAVAIVVAAALAMDVASRG